MNKPISDQTNEVLANSDEASTNVPKPKPPKLEDKPFEAFVNEDLIPGLETKFVESGFPLKSIKLKFGDRPVVGGSCWMVIGEMPSDRRFWLCFANNQLTSTKTLCLAEPGSDPSLLESFLIDEKKATLALLISRLLQRLNGQKWLGSN